MLKLYVPVPPSVIPDELNESPNAIVPVAP